MAVLGNAVPQNKKVGRVKEVALPVIRLPPPPPPSNYFCFIFCFRATTLNTQLLRLSCVCAESWEGLLRKKTGKTR